MEDNLETKVAKLVKYGNEKFGLSETTLRGVLDNASGSEYLDTELNTQDSLLADLETNINSLPEAGQGGSNSDEWQPNPTWWDIEKIYNEDTTKGYTYKTIFLIDNAMASTKINTFINFVSEVGLAMKTSDGAFYENVDATATHTWDTSKDKPCLIDGEEVYKTRYIIIYYNEAVAIRTTTNQQFIIGIIGDYFGTSAIVQCEFMKVNAPDLISITQGNINSPYPIKHIEFINQANITGSYPIYGKKGLNNVNLENATNVNATLYRDKVLDRLYLPNVTTFSVERNVNLVHIKGVYLPKATSLPYAFRYVPNLVKIDELYIPSVTSNVDFGNSQKIREINNITVNMTGSYVFASSLQATKLTGNINMYGYTGSQINYNNAKYLKEIGLKNILKPVRFSSEQLTTECILSLFKELHIVESTQTFTLPSGVYSDALSPIYVKLIDVTDEMRAEDEYIDNKKPFIVCESTDTGAMTIEEYVTSKNWSLSM